MSHDFRSYLLTLLVVSLSTASLRAADETSALALFDRRILPIMKSEKPSSCSECHLSGVNLRDYVRASQQETFASLVAEGLIDVKKPDDSKLLKFIARKPEKPNLVTDKVRQEEFAAFQAWVRAAVRDPKLLAARDAAAPIGPQLPVEVVRHARQDRVLASFIDNVWNEVGRCAGCHSPDRNKEQTSKHGAHISWIKLSDPRATLEHLLEHELIDVEHPEQSLLLRKPLMQVKHGGGQKMVVGDRTHKQFRRFIDDYAATAHGKYKSAQDLPPVSAEVSQTTEIWLKFSDVPAELDKVLLQVDLHRQEENGWSKERVATSDRLIWGGGKLWQHSLSLVAPRDSNWAKQLAGQKLPPGKYLAKIYLDRAGKLVKNPDAELGAAELAGQVEIQSNWPSGYGQMTIVKYPVEKK